MSAVASRYGKDDDDPLRAVARTTTPFVLWRGMPTAPRAATRMPTAASRSGPKVASLDHEDARNCLTRDEEECNSWKDTFPSSHDYSTPTNNYFISKVWILSSVHTKSVNAKVESIYLSAYIDDGVAKTTASH
ncbi:uncharacterized protein LOC121982381 [Zingiber officinale]|uniref:uncharacterized protein LOC121982381 n=1 Tax=Zingiber officinale TaxID=94328 RepID=UPI001C4B090A|nr:uncharacterized protein LOC121982381 [Zingiber officinale]